MKTTKCALCGRNFSIADETVYDQHVLCPYCGGKFSYLADSPEFSVERLSYAIAECRKDGQDRRYYDAAPAGARLYIGLLFYGKVFRDRMNRDLYLAEMAEIESEMKDADWSYLLEHEDDPELADYFRGKLPEGRGKREKKQTENHTHPKLGILRSPTQVRKTEATIATFEQMNERLIRRNPEPKGKGRRSPSSALVLAAGICGVLIVCFILIRSVTGGSGNSSYNRPTVVSASEDGRRERDELLNEISKRLTEFENRRETVSRSIEEIRANRNLFMNELNGTIERGNARSAEIQATGRVRLNSAETAMSVLRAPFFNAFAIRYCGDRPFQKADECRKKVRQVIDASPEMTSPAIEFANQLAVACQENAVGDVRRAIDDKFNSMTELRKAIADTIRDLNGEMIEIRTLEPQQIQARRSRLENIFRTESFTAECGVVSVDEYLKEPIRTEDEFVLSKPVRAVETASEDAIPNGSMAKIDSPDETRESSRKKDDLDLSGKIKETQKQGKSPDFSKRKDERKEKPKGRRQKCKSPIKCLNFAEPGHNFCSEHECHSYGCKAHVRTLTSPNWVHGGMGAILAMSTAEKNRIKRKRIGQFCPKHCCNRICPEIKNYAESWDDYLFWDNDKTEKFFFCDNERLANSRYCSEHACKIPTCGSFREEYWKLDDGTDRTEATLFVDSGNYWWRHLRKWMLITGPMCRAHGNRDPESVQDRNGKTPGDLLREKEEAHRQK